MSRIFDIDNPVMVTLTRIFDMMFLSIIYIISCIPIITIGAATTSLYYVCAKVIRHQEGYVWREYIKSFKLNFKQSTVYWVIAVVIYLLLAWNINFLGLNDDSVQGYGGILSAVYLAMMILLACVTLNIFPIISRFDNKLMTSVKFAIFCTFRHFLHTAVMFILVLLLAYYAYISWATPLMVLFIILPALVCFIITLPMEHVLKKYMPHEEQKLDADGNPIHMWYE